jgi:hypothetical protein
LDEAVIRAMARWPDAPAVFGWLALHRRGRWCLWGEPVTNARANAFISRNYAADERGRWFFQNGPQRVFVDLEYTPWVVLLADGGVLVTHTGRIVRRVLGAWLDEDGALVLQTEHGAALVAERDLPALAERLVDRRGQPCEERDLEAHVRGEVGRVSFAWDGARVALGLLRADTAPARFGYDPRPRQDRG